VRAALDTRGADRAFAGRAVAGLGGVYFGGFALVLAAGSFAGVSTNFLVTGLFYGGVAVLMMLAALRTGGFGVAGRPGAADAAAIAFWAVALVAFLAYDLAFGDWARFVLLVILPYALGRQVPAARALTFAVAVLVVQTVTALAALAWITLRLGQESVVWNRLPVFDVPHGGLLVGIAAAQACVLAAAVLAASPRDFLAGRFAAGLAGVAAMAALLAYIGARGPILFVVVFATAAVLLGRGGAARRVFVAAAVLAGLAMGLAGLGQDRRAFLGEPLRIMGEALSGEQIVLRHRLQREGVEPGAGGLGESGLTISELRLQVAERFGLALDVGYGGGAKGRERVVDCEALSDGQDSTSIRLVLWRETAAVAAGNVLAGVGPHQFWRYTCVHLAVPHNTILQAFAELGLLGGIPYAAFVAFVGVGLARALLSGLRARDPAAQAAVLPVALLWGVALACDQLYGNVFMNFQFMLASGVAVSLLRGRASGGAARPASDRQRLQHRERHAEAP